MNEQEQQAGAGPVERPVGRLDPERLAFEDWADERWGREAHRHKSDTSGEWDAWRAARVDLKDLALMIGRLVTALRKARPMAPQDLDYQALDLLARKGLKPSPLRETPNGPVEAGPTVLRWTSPRTGG